MLREVSLRDIDFKALEDHEAGPCVGLLAQQFKQLARVFVDALAAIFKEEVNHDEQVRRFGVNFKELVDQVF